MPQWIMLVIRGSNWGDPAELKRARQQVSTIMHWRFEKPLSTLNFASRPRDSNFPQAAQVRPEAVYPESGCADFAPSIGGIKGMYRY
jgi:hypothetical protein